MSLDTDPPPPTFTAHPRVLAEQGVVMYLWKAGIVDLEYILESSNVTGGTCRWHWGGAVRG